MDKALQSSGLADKKVTLFVGLDDMVTRRSFINLPNVTIVSFDQANAYDCVHSPHWVVINKDIDTFKQMVSRWI